MTAVQMFSQDKQIGIGTEVEDNDVRFFVGAINESHNLCSIDKSKPWTVKTATNPMRKCMEQGNYSVNAALLRVVPIATIQAAIAQPVQPAVTVPSNDYCTGWNDAKRSITPLLDHIENLISAQSVQPATKLLTPSQIAGLIDDVIDTDDASLVLFARAVEAAHGITTLKETK